MLLIPESFISAFTQAKGMCEDYNTVLPEATMSSFNHSSPGPTVSVLEEQPVTRGELENTVLVFQQKLSPTTGEGLMKEYLIVYFLGDHAKCDPL